jgi:hypothetical protein
LTLRNVLHRLSSGLSPKKAKDVRLVQSCWHGLLIGRALSDGEHSILAIFAPPFFGSRLPASLPARRQQDSEDGKRNVNDRDLPLYW